MSLKICTDCLPLNLGSGLKSFFSIANLLKPLVSPAFAKEPSLAKTSAFVVDKKLTSTSSGVMSFKNFLNNE